MPPAASSTPSVGQRLDAEELRRVVTACVRAAGVGDVAAGAFGDHIVEAHLRGVETHGLRRLRPYLQRIATGGVAASAAPVIESGGAIARVDGANAIGHHVATLAADAAVDRARAHGVGVALVRNSNHFGFAGYYASRMAASGMLAMVTSNGQVMVGPEGALRPLFSNNPVAISAPTADGRMLELDLATSLTSRQNIVRAAESGQAIPPGAALDRDGHPTTDARAALDGLLLAFGGARGFALLTAVEVITGILTGGAYADLVASKEASPGSPEGTAHFMLAIDLEQAIGRALFADRMDDLVQRIEALPMRDGVDPPRVPGYRRWQLRAERLADGIPMAPLDLDSLLELCTVHGIEPPQRKTSSQ